MAGINLGAYFSGGSPAASVDVTAYAPGLLGQTVTLNVGTPLAPQYITYMYVKAGGTIAANDCCLWNGTTTQVGNEVIQSGTATSGRFAGVATAAATVGQFLWIQMGRAYGTTAPVTVKDTGAVAANATIKTSTAGNVAAVAAVTDPCIGYSLTADVAGVITAFFY